MAQLPFKNIDLFNPSLAGKIDYAFDTPYAFQDVLETETTKQKSSDNQKPSSNNEGMSESEYRKATIDLIRDSVDLRKQLLSPEYQQAETDRLDNLQARQMARAQKYGKESAMYGFFYQGLPSLMAQAAFSRYAFAPEAVKGVQDAYRRLDLAGAVKPQGGQSYMSVNPMG